MKIKASVFCFIVLLVACNKENNKYQKYETESYSISNSMIESNRYLKNDGSIGIIPFLPNGLYIRCSDKKSVKLDLLNRREDITQYPINNVRKIFARDNILFVLTDTDIRRIDINNLKEIESEESDVMLKSVLLFNSDEIDSSFKNKYVQNAFSIQSKKINKMYNVDYSTPIVNGILRLGLYDNNFYFGETLYAYFILDLKNSNVIYFDDKVDYDEYCKERIDNIVEVLESKYLYD